MDGMCTSEKHGSMVVYVGAWLSTAEYSRAQYRHGGASVSRIQPQSLPAAQPWGFSTVTTQ